MIHDVRVFRDLGDLAVPVRNEEVDLVVRSTEGWR